MQNTSRTANKFRWWWC